MYSQAYVRAGKCCCKPVSSVAIEDRDQDDNAGSARVRTDETCVKRLRVDTVDLLGCAWISTELSGPRPQRSQDTVH